MAPRVVRTLAVLRQRDLPAWQQDGMIALFTLVIGGAAYLTQIGQLPPGADRVGLWVRLVELTVICGLELLRRWVPGAVLLATAVVAVDLVLGASLPILLFYTDFLFAATLYGSRRTNRIMICIAAFSPLVLLIGLLVLTHDWRAAVISTLSLLPMVLVPVWWAANVRQHRDIADTERANAVQSARIAELDRRAAVAAERARMARDLHDIVAGHLSAIAIQSEAALSMADDGKTARTVLVSVRENSVDALEEMRAMIGLLHTDADGIAETAAPARLAELSRLIESARASGMHVTVKSTVDEPVTLPAAVDLTAYRIAQEALTNTVKHAPGGRVSVNIRRGNGLLTVEVGNELRGPTQRSTATGTGHGLLNMGARASAVGGTLSAGPVGTGWLVRAELPVAEGPA